MSGAVDELIVTARLFHSWHRMWWGWCCPGCRILARIDQESAA